MKFLTRTITLLVVFNVVTGTIAVAQTRPRQKTLTISGSTGIAGVMMTGLPGNIVSDKNGYYIAKVMYGWSGIVTPTKQGYTFEPERLSYSRVMKDQTNGNYTPSETGHFDPYSSLGGSRSRSGRRGSASSVDMMYDPAGFPPRGISSGYRPAVRSGGRKVLVIPASEINEFNAEEFAETVEDMHVMAHILDEQFTETRRIQGMFTDFGAFFGRDSRSTEATYLQDFGVLFLMEVNFAFSPPVRQQTKDQTETAETGDSTWQKARQRVLSPGASPGMDQVDSARDYDDQMVEELKKELVEALKHASNIRNIKADEWVILTVIGGQRQFGMSFGGGFPMGGGASRFESSSRSGGSSGGAMGGGYGGGGGGFVMGGYGAVGGMMGSGMSGGMGGMYGGMATYSGTTFSSSTVLTIRAKKADVDDFAEGQLDLKQFQERVQIFMY